MQVVDADEYGISVAVDEFDHFLRFAVDSGNHQAAELTYTVIRVYHIIADLQLIEFFERHHRFASACIIRGESNTMVTFENLMIGVASNLVRMIHPSAMQCVINRSKQFRTLLLLVR